MGSLCEFSVYRIVSNSLFFIIEQKALFGIKYMKKTKGGFIQVKRAIFAFFAFICLFLSVSCAGEPPNDADTIPEEIIYIPPSPSLGRDQTKFSDILYIRPNTEKLVKDFEETRETIKANLLPFDVQLQKVISTEELYTEFITMYSYAVIAVAKNSADPILGAEHKFLSSEEPRIMRAAEDMMVAAANSPHANRFEDEYFGDGFIAEYKDGGRYTDTIVALLETEAALESEYSSISTASVEITFDGITESVDKTKERIEAKYRAGSSLYKAAMAKCTALYEQRRYEISKALYVELLKVRRQIADEYGYESYREYAYSQLSHDYSPEDMDNFIDSIADYAVPVYAALSNEIFYPYLRNEKAPSVSEARVMNVLYSIYTDMENGLGEIYASMLARGLFDISGTIENRSDGAFTTYLYDYEAPFVFATLDGTVEDYMTVSHEFGHFTDSHLNYGAQASIDIMEISSQGLELLTLNALGDRLSDSEYKYLLYSEMEGALLTMIIQGFYARFEQLAYELPKEQITEARLTDLISLAASEMGLRATDISAVMIDHIILYPFYVQSYCPSMAVSLDIYFREVHNAGAGISAYKALVSRDENSDFVTELLKAGLKSPFDGDFVKRISDEIYYSINGYYYYKDATSGENAA